MRPQPDAGIPAPTAVLLAPGDTPTLLGSSGDDFMDTCAEGQALVGYTGDTTTVGSFSLVGELVGHCGGLHVGAATGAGYAVTATPGVQLPLRGADTADRWTLQCPTDQFVAGISARTGTALDQVTLQCAPISLIATAAGWVAQVGVATAVGPVGGTGGGAGDAPCPAGQIVTMSHTRVVGSPVYLGAIGPGCSRVSGQ